MLEVPEATCSTVTTYVESLLREELASGCPQVVKLSLALGAVEAALTARVPAQRLWPTALPSSVAALLADFDRWVDDLAAQLAHGATLTARAKITAVADAVWKRLQKGYAKDLLHAQVSGPDACLPAYRPPTRFCTHLSAPSPPLSAPQHLYNFALLLPPGGPPAGLRRRAFASSGSGRPPKWSMAMAA